MDSASQMESAVKRVISAQYKDLFGKGPDETTVQITENIMVIKFTGILTRIEETLHRVEQGDALIREIRESIISIARRQYLPELESIAGRHIEHMTYYFSDATNQMYLFIVFEEGH